MIAVLWHCKQPLIACWSRYGKVSEAQRRNTNQKPRCGNSPGELVAQSLELQWVHIAWLRIGSLGDISYAHLSRTCRRERQWSSNRPMRPFGEPPMMTTVHTKLGEGPVDLIPLLRDLYV